VIGRNRVGYAIPGRESADLVLVSCERSHFMSNGGNHSIILISHALLLVSQFVVVTSLPFIEQGWKKITSGMLAGRRVDHATSVTLEHLKSVP
jgi:hypothetical protein